MVKDGYEVVEAISTIEQLKKHLRSYYVIHDYMGSRDDFVKFREQMYDLIKGCYEHRELRKYPIKFKFYDHDTEYHTLELRHFCVNLFYWYPFIYLYKIPDVMDGSFIINCYEEIPHISDKINYLSETLRAYNVKNIQIDYSVSEALYNLRRVSGDFSRILSVSFDIFTIMDLFQRYPELRELMTYRLPDGLQPAEIEAIQQDHQKKIVEFFKKLSPDSNGISVILQAGTGIKHKQLSEFLCMEGLKPDLTGKTIPIPIKNSTILGGLKSASDLYIDAIGKHRCRCKTL